jgi:hypothetical protein
MHDKRWKMQDATMSEAALVDRELDRDGLSGPVDDRVLSLLARLLPRAQGPPDWWNEAMQQLQAIRSVGENWDGYGAAAPRPEIIRSAEGFLHFLAKDVSVPAPYISPTRTGGVLFEWAHGPHQLEVDVYTRDDASYVYLNGETDGAVSGWLFRDNADDGRFLEIVRSFFGSDLTYEG